jgi:Flp pilus assembly protein TadG
VHLSSASPGIASRPRGRRRNLSALAGDASGLALIEFAMSLPVLLVLGLVGLETANYAMAHLRVSNIAMMTADNAARVRDVIDEGDIVELFTGAKMTGDNIGFAQNGRIILSDLEAGAGTRQWIRWQRCDGALNVASSYGFPMTASGVAISNGTEIFDSNRTTPSTSPSSSNPSGSTLVGMGPPANRIAAQPGTAVMTVEVVYRYQPIIPNSFLENREIRYMSAFNVRQRTNQALQNAAAITPYSCNRVAA